MWQPGETTGFTVADHIRALHRHSGGKLLDYAVINLKPIPEAMKQRYAREQAMPVESDINAIYKLGLKVLAGRFAHLDEKVRHDPATTAEAIVRLAKEGRRRKTGAA
jgi:uncharacterized cofD-like protein